MIRPDHIAVKWRDDNRTDQQQKLVQRKTKPLGESWCVVSWESEIGEWGLRVETFESLVRLFSFRSNGAATNICSALRTSLTRKAPRTLFSKSWREPTLEGDFDD